MNKVSHVLQFLPCLSLFKHITSPAPTMPFSPNGGRTAGWGPDPLVKPCLPPASNTLYFRVSCSHPGFMSRLRPLRMLRFDGSKPKLLLGKSNFPTRFPHPKYLDIVEDSLPWPAEKMRLCPHSLYCQIIWLLIRLYEGFIAAALQDALNFVK